MATFLVPPQCDMYTHKKCLKTMVVVCGYRVKDKVFGVPLSYSLERVPRLVRLCVAEVSVRGAEFEELYLKTGDTSKVKRVVRSFENAANLVDLNETPLIEVATVLKIYLKLAS